MDAFGAVLWAAAALLILIPLLLAGVFARRSGSDGGGGGGGAATCERPYLVVSWATFPLLVPLLLLSLLPSDPDLPPVFVLLGLVRGIGGLLLTPPGLLLVLLAARRPGGAATSLPWLAITTAVNALPLLLVALKR